MTTTMSSFPRVGFGLDVHKLVSGRELWLGGVRVPYEYGLEGHSDADVLTHAVCDALLGAANLRDIGYHFPDSDPLYRGADSCELLRRVVALLGERGYVIGNVDATIVAQQPKLSPYIPRMCARLSEVMGVDEGAVSVKATTTELLGFAGRGEGIAAYAVAIICQAAGE